MWEAQCKCPNGEAVRQAEQEIGAGEGQQGSDVEPETQTDSQFRENHFVWVWKEWTDWGEEVEMAFLLLSTSISQCFPSTIPLSHHLSFPSSDYPPIRHHICGKKLSVKHGAVLLKPACSPQKQVSPYGQLEEMNIFNMSYSHRNLILQPRKKCWENVLKQIFFNDTFTIGWVITSTYIIKSVWPPHL